MPTNEQIVREVYAAAEASNLDLDRFVSLFAKDGYFLDMASGLKWTGSEIRQPIEGIGTPFPDFHRELLNIYCTDEGVVVVELRLQGTHKGDFLIPGGGVLPATARKFDVPCCDIFILKDGKVQAFHCYNMRSIWIEQLTTSDT